MIPHVLTVPLVTAFEAPLTAEVFLLGRIVFGAVLAFMGLNHFLDTESMTGYAAAKGIPAPRASVLLSGGTLVAGGLGIAAGIAPTLATGGIIVFFLVTTPTMHDFWAVSDEETQSEMTHFLKNVVVLAGALVLFALSATDWPYAVGLAVF
jgi:putative oxidoreductase